MNYNPEKHYRRSIRLKDYDYSQPGVYFVTNCAWKRECLFGEIVDGEMKLNEYGNIAERCLNEIHEHFKNVSLDFNIVMPNHVHLILIIRHPGRGSACRAPTNERFGKPVTHSIPTSIRSFKSAVTKQINQIRNHPGLPLWQRNYYERVIRNEEEFFRIREYIQNNPMQWDSDMDNPMNTR